MTREIKFRGKRLDGQGWAIGNFFKTPLTADFDLDPEHGAFFASDGKERHCIADEIGCVFEVDPDTVGQFTGKDTEKGREIYEGDICFEEIENDQGDERMYYICVWVNEWSQYAWLFLPGEYHDYQDNGVLNFDSADYFGLETKRLHYAGNIHDNPELLNEE